MFPSDYAAVNIHTKNQQVWIDLSIYHHYTEYSMIRLFLEVVRVMRVIDISGI